jgi:hypothetical protein
MSGAALGQEFLDIAHVREIEASKIDERPKHPEEQQG